MTNKRRWRQGSKKSEPALMDFLKEQEPCCVAACARILRHKPSQNGLWLLHNAERTIDAMLLYFHQSFFPVFRGDETIPIPYFLRYALLVNPLHAIQGPAEDALILENAIDKTGRSPRESRDYDLMRLEGEPEPTAGGPPGLILRRPEPKDAGEVFALQAAYEEEEVLPLGAGLNPAGCRMTVEQLIKNEFSLIAVLDNRIAGKINISAESFNYCQVGGVYVLPRYRGRGIARILGTAFARNLLSRGKKLTLFVKQNNVPAKKTYAHIGFTTIGGYRISYY